MEIAFVVGGLGFEFCVFVAGWRHALRSEWPFIIILMEIELYPCLAFPSKSPNGAWGPEPKGQTREVEALGWTDEDWGPGTTD